MEKLISVATMRDSDAAEIASGTESKTLMYRPGWGCSAAATGTATLTSSPEAATTPAMATYWRCCYTGTASPAVSSAPAKNFHRTAHTFSSTVRQRGFLSSQKLISSSQISLWTACWAPDSTGSCVPPCGILWSRSTHLRHMCSAWTSTAV